jgi:hypothetical protein
MAEKKTTKPDLGPRFVVAQEGNPDAPTAAGKLWVAELNDGDHTVQLHGKTKEQVEDRAREIIAAREATAEAAKAGEAWDGVTEDRTQAHVTRGEHGEFLVSCGRNPPCSAVDRGS